MIVKRVTTEETCNAFKIQDDSQQNMYGLVDFITSTLNAPVQTIACGMVQDVEETQDKRNFIILVGDTGYAFGVGDWFIRIGGHNCFMVLTDAEFRMMYKPDDLKSGCTHCNACVRRGMKFCHNCGRDLRN